MIVEQQRDAYRDCLRRCLDSLDRMGTTPAVVADIEQTLTAENMDEAQTTDVWVYEVHPFAPGSSNPPRPQYFHDEDQTKQFIANHSIVRAFRVRLEAGSVNEGKPFIGDNPYSPQWSSVVKTFYKEAERIPLDVTKTVVLASAEQKGRPKGWQL